MWEKIDRVITVQRCIHPRNTPVSWKIIICNIKSTFKRTSWSRVVFTRQITPIWLRGVTDNKVRGAKMGPTWGRQDPGRSHVGPMNFAVWGSLIANTTLGPTTLRTMFRKKWRVADIIAFKIAWECGNAESDHRGSKFYFAEYWYLLTTTFDMMSVSLLIVDGHVLLTSTPSCDFYPLLRYLGLRPQNHTVWVS